MADHFWQHLPFDVIRNIIEATSRLPLDRLCNRQASSPDDDRAEPFWQQPLPSTPSSSSSSSTPPASPPRAGHSAGATSSSPDNLSSPVTAPNPNAAPAVSPPATLEPPASPEFHRLLRQDEPQEELLLQCIRTLRLVCTAWRDAAAAAVTQLQLQSLDVVRPGRPLHVAFPELASLDLSCCSRLFDEDVVLLSGCKSLTELKLPAQQLTSEGIAALAPLTALERLEISGLRVPYALAHILRALPGVRHVTVRGCALQLLPPPPAPPSAGVPPPPPPPPPPPRPHTLAVSLTPAQKRFPSSRRSLALAGTAHASAVAAEAGGGGVSGQRPVSAMPVRCIRGPTSLTSAAAAPPPRPAQRGIGTAPGQLGQPPPPPPGPPPPPPLGFGLVRNPPGPRPPPPPPLIPPPPPPPLLLNAIHLRRATAARPSGSSTASGSGASRSAASASSQRRVSALAAAQAALAPAEAAARLAVALYGTADNREYDSEGKAAAAADTAGGVAAAAAAAANVTLIASPGTGPCSSQLIPLSPQPRTPEPAAPATVAAPRSMPLLRGAQPAGTSAAAVADPRPPRQPLPLPPLTAPPLEWCAAVPALQSLHLVEVRGSWLDVSALRRLTELVVRECSRPEVERPFVALADGLTGLRRLALCGSSSQLSGSDLAEGVSRLRELRVLVMESPAVVPHQLVLRQDLDQLLPSLAFLAASLDCLILRRPGWNQDRLRALAPLTALTRLEVGDWGPAGRGGRFAAGGGGGGGGGGGLGVGTGAGGGLSGDPGLQALASLFPRLRSFSLGPPSSDSVTEEGVAALAGRLKQLTRLELQGCSRLRNERLAPLLAAMTGLQYLDLSNCLNLLDTSLPHLTGLSALSSLKLRGCWKVSGEGLGSLRPPGLRLRRLDLSECRVTDEGLQQVAELTALTRLQLARSWYVRAPGLAALARLRRLAVLDLGSTNTDNVGVEQMVVGLGDSLTDLDLSATLISAPGVRALAEGLPRLRRLKLNKCPGLDDTSLEELSRLSCLRRLHVQRCRNIGDAAVRCLADCLPRLQHFELDGCWRVAMKSIDKLYGRPKAEWRRAADVQRAAEAAGATGVGGVGEWEGEGAGVEL